MAVEHVRARQVRKRPAVKQGLQADRALRAVSAGGLRGRPKHPVNRRQDHRRPILGRVKTEGSFTPAEREGARGAARQDRLPSPSRFRCPQVAGSRQAGAVKGVATQGDPKRFIVVCTMAPEAVQDRNGDRSAEGTQLR